MKPLQKSRGSLPKLNPSYVPLSAVNGGNREKFERFPPQAGGTYRRGDETPAENYAFTSKNEPILCTLIRRFLGEMWHN